MTHWTGSWESLRRSKYLPWFSPPSPVSKMWGVGWGVKGEIVRFSDCCPVAIPDSPAEKNEQAISKDIELIDPIFSLEIFESLLWEKASKVWNAQQKLGGDFSFSANVSGGPECIERTTIRKECLISKQSSSMVPCPTGNGLWELEYQFHPRKGQRSQNQIHEVRPQISEERIWN